MLIEREQRRLALLIPNVSNAEMHKLIPVYTRKVDPKTIQPEVVAANLVEVAAPYLAAFHCHESALTSISCSEAIKLVAKYTPIHKAIIYAGFMLSFQKTSFSLLPADELYEVNVSLKEHVKAIAEFAAEAPVLVRLDIDEILRGVIYVA